MAGYSKRTLIEKLGLKLGQKVYLENIPKSYEIVLKDIRDKVSLIEQLFYPIDFIHFFAKEKGILEKKFPLLKKSLAKDGMLWISWPKGLPDDKHGSSRIQTDLNENIIREIGLTNGLVDVKVAAIDTDWSGLKFVFRLKDR